MLEDNSNKRRSLGRGLGALLGDMNLQEAPSRDKQSLSINLLSASRFQPRLDFDKEALEALSNSIKEKGVLQPLLVRDAGDGSYEIIAGERRFRAAQMAGLSEVPVIIKDMEDKEVLEVALIENLLRENLSPIEEAEALQRLIDEFSHTQEAVSQVIGKSRVYVTNTLRLLSLPIEAQQMVRDGVLSAGHVRPFVGMQNALELIKKVAAKGLNSRQAEELAAKEKAEKKQTIKNPNSEDVKDIAQSLSKRLGLDIKISAGSKGSGKIVLNFANAVELDKIVDILERRAKLS